MNPTVPVKPPGFLPLIFRMLEPLGRGGFVLLFARVGLANLGLTPGAAAAAAAGCAANKTPFNGDHTAGLQVLNTTRRIFCSWRQSS